jgi:hypothetical protein
VVVSDRFRNVSQDVHRNVREALLEAAHVAEEVAKATAEASGYNLGPVAESITHTPPLQRRRGGWYLYVYNPDFRALFFERGTYHHKGRKRSKRQKDVEGNRGVRAIHILRAGARAAKPVLLERLRSDLR